jgi:hypothetical protein
MGHQIKYNNEKMLIIWSDNNREMKLGPIYDLLDYLVSMGFNMSSLEVIPTYCDLGYSVFALRATSKDDFIMAKLLLDNEE